MQISQEAGQMVWYSILFKSFPQLVAIHIAKDFGIVDKEMIQKMLAIWWTLRLLQCIDYCEEAEMDLRIQISLKGIDFALFRYLTKSGIVG